MEGHPGPRVSTSKVEGQKFRNKKSKSRRYTLTWEGHAPFVLNHNHNHNTPTIVVHTRSTLSWCSFHSCVGCCSKEASRSEHTVNTGTVSIKRICNAQNQQDAPLMQKTLPELYEARHVTYITKIAKLRLHVICAQIWTREYYTSVMCNTPLI